jgi:hypothetical protein
MRPEKGVLFLRGIFPSKIGPKDFYWDTIQALSKTCAFLLSKKKRRLLCMGRTSTANKPLPLNNCPKQLSVSWESNPARVKASKTFQYLIYILKIFGTV